MEYLKAKIWQFLCGNDAVDSNDLFVPQWKMQCEWKSGPTGLVVLDDVWSYSVLEQLVSRVPGCKTLVVSRFMFPTIVKATYDIELLKEDEAMTLFSLSAFCQESVPPDANETLVKQVM